MSNETFGPVLPQLAERHQVIAPDLQGHGRTADIDRPIDVRLMADDIAALIDHLGLEKPDLVGYSLGGGVALHTAAKYPAKVRRLGEGRPAGGHALAILPGLTHYNIGASPLFAAVALAFLDDQPA